MEQKCDTPNLRKDEKLHKHSKNPKMVSIAKTRFIQIESDVTYGSNQDRQSRDQILQTCF
ncbi:hypothetical protein HanXRQr2_Chr16g0730191 [Helianthus annuus]|uniref:Uncharacterized protein n=1 Tax=Helianthus annuus TaxID=4232 RepID=A0A9K3DPR7_HELAN|nr:hypothetical protein HanXRQr2_Chr16g0730191 [Helianthus annuus]